MNALLMSLLDGLVYGLILFMLSAGLTLIYGMMGVLNMAHSAFFMLGAYIAFTISGVVNFWLGLIIAPLIVAVLGLVVEQRLLRRIHGHGHGQELLFTFGLAYAIEEGIKLFYGDFPVNYSIPASLRFPAFTLFGADFPFYRLLMACIAICIFGVLVALLRFTRLGLIVRAAEKRPVMAAALGHDVSKVFSGIFALGTGLAALAGAVAGAYYPTSPTMSINFGIVVFIVVVVGGLGSIQGSFWASLLIGVLTSVAISMPWTLSNIAAVLGASVDEVQGLGSVAVSDIAGLMPYLLMIGILVFKPTGLMGESK